MQELYPLTFEPNLHTALWGVESWEISGHHSSPSVVAEGPLAGSTLEELAARYGRRLTGTRAPVLPAPFAGTDDHREETGDGYSLQLQPEGF